MKITHSFLPIRELVEGFSDTQDQGVVGMNGRLNIRPAFQREFVYTEKQQSAVIQTVLQGYPLGVLYWTQHDDGTLEVIDGQQRILSICRYVANLTLRNERYFGNEPKDIQEKILNYELSVHFCEGEESERLEWFEIINTAGEKLTTQELRNAVYTGPWLTDAKSKFSTTAGPIAALAGDYVKGSAIRQELLETFLKWRSKGNIEKYMADCHKDTDNATELFEYARNVIHWVERTFPKHRKEMKGVPWGPLHDEVKETGKELCPIELEGCIKVLMQDEEVTKKAGIYPYLITGDERFLNIRTFSDKVKRETYERQGGVCALTYEPMDISKMEADHIIPWSKGGKTIPTNCQMVGKKYNKLKSNH